MSVKCHCTCLRLLHMDKKVNSSVCYDRVDRSFITGFQKPNILFPLPSLRARAKGMHVNRLIYRFWHVSCTRVHAAQTLLIAAASTSEHVHTGRLEEFVGCRTQLFGNLHTGFPWHTLSLLPFLIYDWREHHFYEQSWQSKPLISEAKTLHK